MKKLNELPWAPTDDAEGAMSARANPRTTIRFIVFPFCYLGTKSGPKLAIRWDWSHRFERGRLRARCAQRVVDRRDRVDQFVGVGHRFGQVLAQLDAAAHLLRGRQRRRSHDLSLGLSELAAHVALLAAKAAAPATAAALLIEPEPAAQIGELRARVGHGALRRGGRARRRFHQRLRS